MHGISKKVTNQNKFINKETGQIKLSRLQKLNYHGKFKLGLVLNNMKNKALNYLLYHLVFLSNNNFLKKKIKMYCSLVRCELNSLIQL